MEPDLLQEIDKPKLNKDYHLIYDVPGIVVLL